MTLRSVISGGQTGADTAALRVAKAWGFTTGGWMPRGFRRIDRSRPDYAHLFGMREHGSRDYPPRTHANVHGSDGTMRFAVDFQSAGERCTFTALQLHRRPWFDVAVPQAALQEPTRWIRQVRSFHPSDAAEWLRTHGIHTLNVAGNSERTAPGIERAVEAYLNALFVRMPEAWAHAALLHVRDRGSSNGSP
jgi:putative molybdenum carrier protein